jgi:maleate isomerase
MYGWRARIGGILLSSDTTTDSEFKKVLPAGISFHVARVFNTPSISTPDELKRMKADLDGCAERIATANVDGITYCCTTGSLIEGPSYERELETKIADAAGVPCVTTAGAVLRAFDALGLESLAITTPYLPEVNEREAAFFEESGYDVVDIDNYRLSNPTKPLDAATPKRAYREARAIDDAAADGVFISCTGYRTFEIIDKLERDLDKPVVTSNQATLWDALRTVDVDYSDIDLGQLFNQ